MEKLQEALVRLEVVQNMSDELGTEMALKKVIQLISSHIDEQKPQPNPETEQKEASQSFQ